MWAPQIALAAAFGLIGSAAVAQMTDQQKRRALLPSIKAATDCIAREAARHPDVVNGYRYNNLTPMIAEGWRACTNSLAEVAVVHDNLHGAGTGIPFVKGAYSDDLPRAVRTRIQAEMDRRIVAIGQAEEAARVEQVKREAERKQNVERLERAADTLRDRAYDCTTDQLAKLVMSAETAEVLSTAAMTICRREIDDALQARVDVVRAQSGPNYSTAGESDFREEMRKIVRNNVVTNAVQIKASQGLGSAPRPSPTTPVAVPPRGSSATVADAGVGLPKELRDCLSQIATARNGKFIEQRKLFEGMLELCRPEIEAAARTAFLAAKDGDLSKEREKALTSASVAAKQLIGMSDQ